MTDMTPHPAGHTPHPLLSAIVQQILEADGPFTDMHIETDMPIMLRQSAYAWIEARINDKPVIVCREQISSFINGIYVGSEEPSPRTTTGQEWRKNLHTHGSLHPSINISALKNNEMASFRLRCTIQKQNMGESLGVVLRPLPPVPESIEGLGLPFQVEKMMAAAYRGLIVVTGPTGSGKSTTLAAMVNLVNRHRAGNILTIEDPVEFVHERKKCIVNQREVGIDVNSFADGVRDALRFVPDVILIGEIRDVETMKAAVRAAESGHLVLTSMHAPTAIAAIKKMLAYLSGNSADAQALSSLLVGVVAQTLVQDIKMGGRNHLASEFLNCRDTRVIKAIGESATSDNTQQTMLTALDQQVLAGELDCAVSMFSSLQRLVREGLVTKENAAGAAPTPEERAKLAR